jgi:hypothetical protein
MSKRLPIFSAALGLLLLTGCAQRYTVTTTNGNTITAHSKPRLNAERSAFIFKGPTGQQMVIPAGKITEIAPVD